MRHLTSLLVLLALDFVPAAAQSDINASILEFTEEFKMSSPTSGTDKVHKTITVFNEEGLSSAQFVVFTDSFRSLGSFGGEIVEPNGKKTKLSKKFLSNTSLSVGLADDYSVVHYTPVFNYPFTVTYDYSVEYHDGIVMFPPFMPLTEDLIQLKIFPEVDVTDQESLAPMLKYLGDADEAVVYIDTSVFWSSGYDADALLKRIADETAYHKAEELFTTGLTTTYLISR